MLPECRCRKRGCKFYKGISTSVYKHYCKAFYEGIPDEIAYGNDEHLTVRKGQSKSVYFMLPDRNIVEPHSVERMESFRGWGRDNLCATLHNIYHMTDDPEIRYWCRIAVTMAKNQTYALMEYKQMLMENNIGTDRWVGVQHDSTGNWQLRKNRVYRGKNIPEWGKIGEEDNIGSTSNINDGTPT